DSERTPGHHGRHGVALGAFLRHQCRILDQSARPLRSAHRPAGSRKNYQGPSDPQAHDRRPRIDQLPTCRMMLDLARSRVAQGQLSRIESGKVVPTLEILLGVAPNSARVSIGLLEAKASSEPPQTECRFAGCCYARAPRPTRKKGPSSCSAWSPSPFALSS